MTSEIRQQYMSQEFRRIFGGDPAVWARAPGRVDLMGSHTDYNMGYVMTMTIDRDTWLAARPRPVGAGDRLPYLWVVVGQHELLLSH